LSLGRRAEWQLFGWPQVRLIPALNLWGANILAVRRGVIRLKPDEWITFGSGHSDNRALSRIESLSLLFCAPLCTRGSPTRRSFVSSGRIVRVPQVAIYHVTCRFRWHGRTLN
jgi:hypothetical protein